MGITKSEDIYPNSENLKRIFRFDFDDLLDCSLLLSDKYNGFNFRYLLTLNINGISHSVNHRERNSLKYDQDANKLGRDEIRFAECRLRYNGNKFVTDIIYHTSGFHNLMRPRRNWPIGNISDVDNTLDILLSKSPKITAIITTSISLNDSNLNHVERFDIAEYKPHARYNGTEKEQERNISGKKPRILFSSGLEVGKIYDIDDFRDQNWYRPNEVKVNGKWIDKDLFFRISYYKLKDEFIKDMINTCGKITKFLNNKNFKVDNKFKKENLELTDHHRTQNDNTELELNYLDKMGYINYFIIGIKEL